MLSQLANPKLVEMQTLAGRIQLCARACESFRSAVAPDDAELIDMIVTSADALRDKLESSLSDGAAATDPSHDLSRDQHHDLRNSITAVLGFSELLGATYTEPEVLVQQFEQLKTDAKALTAHTMPTDPAAL